MTLFRTLIVLSLGVVLTVGASTSRAEKPNKGGKPKGAHAARGVVLDVQKDKDKDEGVLVVRVQHKKKGEPSATPQVEERKFRVNSQTKFEFISGKKGERERKPATFKDVHKGEHVLVVVKGEGQLAERVEIMVRTKGKKETKTE